ncbi:uroporphyrinogen-III synthase [Aquibacillus rhizosphaerae]|uniref:Uroporphyrinogen-III synthase n=1 Tax=Aquibacillus rhizosphaerae TaxID=3051431 RepID=A0ABT7LB11_9BACI|nr:uroporphyrinogen-III synthase [Aquibacillus sp. LR5S19]MDL4843054.1 uroporphyrinogen-III synthase [Aquibacillus sp. LR5S19]
MKELEGKRIGIAADRKSEAISEIIRKKGGIPVIQSIQGQRLLNERQAEEEVQYLIDHEFDWVMLTTGIGAQALEDAATRLGIRNDFIEKLKETKLAIRGSKTIKWLKGWSLKPDFVSPNGTMDQLIEGLRDEEITGSKFFLQEYNKNEDNLIEKLNTLPISLYRSTPYYYVEPEKDTLESLRSKISKLTLDAVLFTSKTQVENLFGGLEDKGSIVNAFQTKVKAVSIGSVTSKELEKNGVKRIIEPENPKMGAMVIELASSYKQSEV